MLLDAVSELHGSERQDKMRWFATLACPPKGHASPKRPDYPTVAEQHDVRHRRLDRSRDVCGTSGAWRRPDRTRTGKRAQHQPSGNARPGTRDGRRQGHPRSAGRGCVAGARSRGSGSENVRLPERDGAAPDPPRHGHGAVPGSVARLGPGDRRRVGGARESVLSAATVRAVSRWGSRPTGRSPTRQPVVHRYVVSFRRLARRRSWRRARETRAPIGHRGSRRMRCRSSVRW